ncbi:hypothetical protein ACFL5O_10030 [Myxococcota bacterium]
MSRWDRWGWYQPAPKKPPPKSGIRMKQSGSTWWGQRWIEALERMSFGYSNRLARGRTYARAGRTHDLVIQEGTVTAKVTGSRTTPYRVTITLGKLPDAVWNKAIAAMARKAQFSAELLAGQMPQEIDTAFGEAGGSVFPIKPMDLTTHCSCPDWANPCKHVAATHYVLGETLDRDPFLLFELRGWSKEQVLEALRAARSGGDVESTARQCNSNGVEASDPVPIVSLEKVELRDYDKLREPLPTLHLSFEVPPISGGVLRQLGAPSGWGSDQSPVELFGPMIRAAAERARVLAMAEPPEGCDPALDPVARTGRSVTRTKASQPRESGSAQSPGTKSLGTKSLGTKSLGTKSPATKSLATKSLATKKPGVSKTETRT